MIVTVDNAMEYLSKVSMTFKEDHRALVNQVFSDPAFAVAPGAKAKHHNYLGGLAHHTAEVVENCLMLTGVTMVEHTADYDTQGFRRFYTGTLDIEALLVAAFLHDYCKTLDYSYDLELIPREDQRDIPVGFAPIMVQRIKPDSIQTTDYSKLVYHVTGGAMVMQFAAMQMGLPPDFVMKVTHIMLAHHGRQEWGSPVEPKTPEAWILHAADMLSAQPL